jgi:hypothetical protein
MIKKACSVRRQAFLDLYSLPEIAKYSSPESLGSWEW